MQVLGFIGLLAIVAFIVFAFRQGMKVKKPGPFNAGPPNDTVSGASSGSETGHHGGH